LPKELREDRDIIPNTGMAKMYTSGCPKNQNICINITGSPPEGERRRKSEVSVSNNIVKAQAKIGMAKITNTEGLIWIKE
jgi:hypothetical protein